MNANSNRYKIKTLTATLVHPRELFRAAILLGAAHVILIHNHPTGDPTPSVEDLDLTERMIAAGDLLGIPVLDHLILGRAGTFRSLR
jgi:DNA repair protein RadC